MNRSFGSIVVRLALFVSAAAFCCRAAAAQDSGSLEDQLKAQYKVTKVGLDSSGVAVTQPGTVLVIQKGGILGVPPLNLAVGTATYKDGEMHSPSPILLGNTTRFLDANEKVYLLKLSASTKGDKVTFLVMECDSCNGANQQSSYKATVVFQYPKGYLATADVGQVEDVIGQVFAIDNGNGGQQAESAPPQQQAPPQPPQPTPQPQSIQLGQTTDQVVAVLGQPDKIVNLGSKQIYVYKDIKVTFVNGKVTDAQ